MAAMVKIPRISSPQSEQQELSNKMLLTMYDLPSEDPEEPGLPDEFHDLQPQLLSRTLQLRQYTQDECFSASDLNLYYDVNHPLWYKRPDWFLVVGVPHLYNGTEMRRSYVRWQEGKSPQVVVEFLSSGTEQEEQAARNLLATGMTPAQVAQILGFSEEQVQLAQSTMPEEPRQALD